MRAIRVLLPVALVLAVGTHVFAATDEIRIFGMAIDTRLSIGNLITILTVIWAGWRAMRSHYKELIQRLDSIEATAVESKQAKERLEERWEDTDKHIKELWHVVRSLEQSILLHRRIDNSKI